MAIIVFIFASPIIFNVVNAFSLTGVELFLANLIPWVGLLTMIGRVLYLIKYGSSGEQQ